MMIKLRYYQEDAISAIFKYFSSHKGNPILALPTGTGKSIVIAEFVRRVLQTWPGQRIIMLTHVKELIAQNAAKLQSIWPNAPMGIYSAGLNSRDMMMPIVFGGVQSVSKAIERELKEPNNYIPDHRKHFGHRDLIIIDECHLVSDSENTQYQYIINELRKINPLIKVIGLSATPYRLKHGMLTEGDSIFTDIPYDITGVESFNRLIAEGYLAPLYPRPTNAVINTNGIGLSGGDFNNKQMSAEVDKVIYQAVSEMVQLGQDRKAWLVFSQGVENAEKISSLLNSFGVDACATHSKLSAKQNDEIISAYKHGELRALVNANKLTTGFDHPPTDLIGVLRATMSPGLWVQMLGRGTRPSPETGKTHCLVLDFAGNTKRLGPINDPVKPRKPGKGEPGDAIVKLCKICNTYNHGSARFCVCCGNEFTFENKIFKTASTEQLIASDLPVIESYKVDKVLYNLHEKKNKSGSLMSPPSMRVTYFCGLRRFDEWVCFEHKGFPLHKAHEWWKQRHSSEPPVFTWQALQAVSELRAPESIKVWVNKDNPEIVSAEW